MKALEYIKQNYWLLAILLAASILRLFRLDFQSVWMDEIYTLNVSSPSLSFEQLHDEVVEKEGFPYLYFLMLRVFYAVFGYTEVVARLLSALGGIAGVAAIYVFGKNIFNKQMGLIAAFLLAINEFHIAASQEARPYSLFVLFALIAFYRLSIFIKEQSLKNAVWFGLAAGLMLNINFFALITLFAQGLILLFVIIFSVKEDRLKLFLRSVLAGIIALLLFAPNYEILIKLMNYQSFWVPAPTEDSAGLIFREMLGNSEITRFIFMTILFYYAVNLFREKIERIDIRSIQDSLLIYSFAILFFWFMSYFGLIYAKSYFGPSLLLNRYLITLLPVILLAIAMGIFLIRNKVAKAALIIGILYFSLVNLIGARKYYTNVTKTQFREVSNYIKENNDADKAEVYTSLKYWYGYFLERGQAKQQLREMPLEEKVRQMMENPAAIKPFWYADGHLRPYALSPEAQAFMDKHFIVGDYIEGFDAWARYYEPANGNYGIDISRFGALKPVNGTPFNYILEIFETTDGHIKAAGWAHFLNQEASKTKISLVLIKGPKTIRLTTLRVDRPDVTSYFKLDYDVRNSGFSTEFDTSALAPGKYKLGIYLINEDTNKEGLAITDKEVIVPGE